MEEDRDAGTEKGGEEIMGSPFGAPNWTQFANYVLDVIQPTLSGNEWKLLTVIIRATWGFVDDETGERKTEDILSYTQLKARTGIRHNATIKKALDALIKRGYILREPAEGYHEGLKAPPFVYSLNTKWKVSLEDLKSRPPGPREPEARMKAADAENEPMESIGSKSESSIGAETEPIEKLAPKPGSGGIGSKSDETKLKVIRNRLEETNNKQSDAVAADPSSSSIPDLSSEAARRRVFLGELEIVDPTREEIASDARIATDLILAWTLWYSEYKEDPRGFENIRNVQGFMARSLQRRSKPPKRPDHRHRKEAGQLEDTFFRDLEEEAGRALPAV